MKTILISRYKKIRFIFISSCLVLFMLSACSKMDSTYKKFIKDGEKTYAGAADSIKIHSGNNRVMINWTVSDPNVNRAKVYWNNRQDSIEVEIQKVKRIDTVSVIIEDLVEGSYSFDVYTFDDKNNRSVGINAIGFVYGESYINSLLSLPVTNATSADGVVTIEWGSADTTAIGSEIIYQDVADNFKHIFIPSSETVSYLQDYKWRSSFQYRTLYKPEPLSIDTFYTEYFTEKPVGVPVGLSKVGWTATASSFDAKENRPPSNAIDENPATIWVNEIGPGITYPHTINVDMSRVEQDIAGFTFIQRTPLNGALKLIEILISQDGIEWISQGEYTLENVPTTQYIDMKEPISFRHFRVIGKNEYGTSANIKLAEVGVFVR